MIIDEKVLKQRMFIASKENKKWYIKNTAHYRIVYYLDDSRLLVRKKSNNGAVPDVYTRVYTVKQFDDLISVLDDINS